MDTQHLGYPNDGGIAPANPSFTGNVDILQSATLKARLSVDSSGNLNIALTEKAPGALTCGLAGGGAGNVNNGAHLYKVTFVTAAGETEAGTASSAVTVVDKTADGKVALSAIPTGSSFVTARKIYRTLAGGTTYKLLTTISDNTSTTYTDNTADASLTTTAPAVNTAIDTRLAVRQNGVGAGALTVADSTARLALTGLGVGAQVYQSDTGFFYTLINAAAPSSAGSWLATPKKYVALLTQSGTDAPVATVLVNTLEFIPVWTYTEAGRYATLLPDTDFTRVYIPNPNNSDVQEGQVGWQIQNGGDDGFGNTVIRFQQCDISTWGSPAEFNGFTAIPFEIAVCPA